MSSTRASTPDPERPQWESRWAFLFAVIGSVVSLANIWRFPYYCHKFGGAAFLLPYVLALVFIGHPVLLLELTMGQVFRAGNMDAFGAINKRMRGLGLASIFGAIVICWYYCVVVGWALVYFIQSFYNVLPYSGYVSTTSLITVTGQCFINESMTFPSFAYSFSKENCSWDTSMNMSGVVDDEIHCETGLKYNKNVMLYVGELSRQMSDELSPLRNQGNVVCKAIFNQTHEVSNAISNFYYVTGNVKNVSEATGYSNPFLIMAVIFVYLCVSGALHGGIKSISAVMKVTMPLPFILLFCLMIKCSLLEGSLTGVQEYMSWDSSVLDDSYAWGAAVSQVIFSLGIGTGIITAYSSYYPHPEHTVSNNHIIVATNALTSFFSGFIVYSVYGFLKKTNQDEDIPFQDGPGIIFQIYPEALALMPGDPHGWAVVFFLSIILIGIDTAFSLAASFITVITDRIGYMRQSTLAYFICIFGLIISINIFAIDSGLQWFYIVQHYVNQYGMVGVVMLECITVGWFFNLETQMRKLGRVAVRLYMGSFFLLTLIAVMLALCVATPVYNTKTKLTEFTGGLGYQGVLYGLWGALIIWIISIWICFNMASIYRAKKKMAPLPFSEMLWELAGWHAADQLSKKLNIEESISWEEKQFEMNELCQKDIITSCASYNAQACCNIKGIGPYWGATIKYFIPPVLFIVLCSNGRQDYYNPYGGYSTRAQGMGIMVLLVMMVVTIFPIIEPEILKSNGKLPSLSERKIIWEVAKKSSIEEALVIASRSMVTRDPVISQLSPTTATQDIIEIFHKMNLLSPSMSFFAHDNISGKVVGAMLCVDWADMHESLPFSGKLTALKNISNEHLQKWKENKENIEKGQWAQCVAFGIDEHWSGFGHTEQIGMSPDIVATRIYKGCLEQLNKKKYHGLICLSPCVWNSNVAKLVQMNARFKTDYNMWEYSGEKPLKDIQSSTKYFELREVLLKGVDYEGYEVEGSEEFDLIEN